jgi:signal transduction histidine kinase
VSHKILNSKIEAEKHMLKLINAAVSHELRSPLFSLMG